MDAQNVYYTSLRNAAYSVMVISACVGCVCGSSCGERILALRSRQIPSRLRNYEGLEKIVYYKTYAHQYYIPRQSNIRHDKYLYRHQSYLALKI